MMLHPTVSVQLSFFTDNAKRLEEILITLHHEHWNWQMKAKAEKQKINHDHKANTQQTLFTKYYFPNLTS